MKKAFLFKMFSILVVFTSNIRSNQNKEKLDKMYEKVTALLKNKNKQDIEKAIGELLEKDFKIVDSIYTKRINDKDVKKNENDPYIFLFKDKDLQMDFKIINIKNSNESKEPNDALVVKDGIDFFIDQIKEPEEYKKIAFEKLN